MQLFRLPLVQVQFSFVSGGAVYMDAVVAGPDLDRPDDKNGRFRVPDPGYDPHQRKDLGRCSRCKPSHRVVPDGGYLPPPNKELHAAVAGRNVLLIFMAGAE